MQSGRMLTRNEFGPDSLPAGVVVESVRRQRRELVVPEVKGQVRDALQSREQPRRELGQLRPVDLVKNVKNNR